MDINKTKKRGASSKNRVHVFNGGVTSKSGMHVLKKGCIY